jgi:hypothetical protein
VKSKKHRIFLKWVEFAEFWNELKCKLVLAKQKVQNFKIKFWFGRLKKLLVIRKRRLDMEKRRTEDFKYAVFKEFRQVVRKSIQLSDAYVEVTWKYRKRLAQIVIKNWVAATDERIEAKIAVQEEIEVQKMQEILIIEQEEQEKEKIIEYAENLYMLNLWRKAIEALRVNMAPRKNYMKKLVQKYYFEAIKNKALNCLKEYAKTSKIERRNTQIVQLYKKQKHFISWLVLLKERRIASMLKTPFVNIQKAMFDGISSEHQLGLITEKVYEFLHFGKKQRVLRAWKGWIRKVNQMEQKRIKINANQDIRIRREYFCLWMDRQQESRQNKIVDSYLVSSPFNAS